MSSLNIPNFKVSVVLDDICPHSPNIHPVYQGLQQLFQVSVVLADITIDLSTAEQDPATGQFCVIQKVRYNSNFVTTFTCFNLRR